MGLLASLLRLADALDFYPDRAPSDDFRTYAHDLLRNPGALEHWTKHYFVQAPRLPEHPARSGSWSARWLSGCRRPLLSTARATGTF